MTTTAIVGGKICTPDKVIDAGTVLIEGSKIVMVGPQGHKIPPSARTIDASGYLVAPGLIDIHFYGCGGHSFAHPKSLIQNMESISELLPRWGTTAFLASSTAANQEEVSGLLTALALLSNLPIQEHNQLAFISKGPF